MKKIILIGLLIFVFIGCTPAKEELKFSGTLEATQFDVATEIGGIIKELDVAEGEQVEEGQQVALLDDTTLQMGAMQLQANYFAQQEQLSEVKKGGREEEIKIAEHQLKIAQTGVQTAKQNLIYVTDKYEKTKKLFEEGSATEQQVKDLELQLEQGKANLQNSEEGVKSARSKLQLLQEGARQETIKAGEYRVEQSKYAYEQATQQAEKAKIKSAHKGIVLYKNFQKGEFLSPGAPLITLMDPQDLWIKIYVPEKYLHFIKNNQQVSLDSDILENTKIMGNVIFISPQAEFTPSNATTKEDRHNRVHEVKIKITEGMDKLNPGMVLDAVLQDTK